MDMGSFDLNQSRPTSPLIEAIEMESEAEAEEWVRKLLDDGENPNAQNPDGGPAPLDVAWVEGRTQIVRMLLDAGAVPERTIDFPSFCLMNAPFEASELILNAGYSFESEIFLNQLGEPMYRGVDPILYRLLRDGSTNDIERFRPFNILCLLNVFDELGCTALHAAARDSEYTNAKWLIENGADVNAVCEGVIGYTPLDYAAENCDVSMVQLLLGAGSNPNIPTWMWLTSLDRAIKELPQNPDARLVYRSLCTASTKFPAPIYPDGRSPAEWPPPLPKK